MILLQHEQHEFDSASVSPPVRRYVTPQFARTGGGAAQLNAGGVAPVPLGPIKQLAVGKGDTLLVTAHGMYPEAVRHPHWALSLAGFVAGLVQQQPVGPLPPDGRQRGRVLPLLNVGLPLATAVPQLAGGVPRAYLRVLVFDQDSTLVDTHTRQLTEAALGNYEPLSLNIVVPQAGYATAYVATESAADVFFDDLTVEHRQGLLVQENHYDPYGLELAGLSQSSPGLKALNQYSWNGKELQTDFGWRLHDHGWRNYDPQLGRWGWWTPMRKRVTKRAGLPISLGSTMPCAIMIWMDARPGEGKMNIRKSVTIA